MSSTDLKSVLQQAYETEYSIYNHTSGDNKPLASIAFFDIENSIDGTPLESITRTYISKNLGELYRMSLIEFLELPRDIVEMLIEIANQEMNRKQPILDNLLKESK
jgi:hypothetical protein